MATSPVGELAEFSDTPIDCGAAGSISDRISQPERKSDSSLSTETGSAICEYSKRIGIRESSECRGLAADTALAMLSAGPASSQSILNPFWSARWPMTARVTRPFPSRNGWIMFSSVCTSARALRTFSGARLSPSHAPGLDAQSRAPTALDSLRSRPALRLYSSRKAVKVARGLLRRGSVGT